MYKNCNKTHTLYNKRQKKLYLISLVFKTLDHTSNTPTYRPHINKFGKKLYSSTINVKCITSFWSYLVSRSSFKTWWHPAFILLSILQILLRKLYFCNLSRCRNLYHTSYQLWHSTRSHLITCIVKHIYF